LRLSGQGYDFRKAADRIEDLERQLAAEREVHEQIASKCFQAGVEAPDGTSVSAVDELITALVDEREAREKAEANCAEMRISLKASLQIPKAWMGKLLTFAEWDAACQKVFDAIEKPNPGSRILKQIAAADTLYEQAKRHFDCCGDERYGLLLEAIVRYKHARRET